jgi:hypothetical protein
VGDTVGEPVGLLVVALGAVLVLLVGTKEGTDGLATEDGFSYANGED